MQLRISEEASAADACEAKIKSLSTSLCRAEKSLEAVIATTKQALVAATEAGQVAPPAAEVVGMAQRIAFTTKVPPYIQPGDCRFRKPWPTEGEFAFCRLRELREAPASEGDVPQASAEPEPSLKRSREEAELDQEAVASPRTGTPVGSPKQVPTKEVDPNSMFVQVEDDDDSDSDSDSDSD